jgi:hypothetical protein
MVQRVIDARVSELVYQRAYRTLKAGLPTDVQSPLDPAVFRQQRDQVLALQAVLKETGGAALGEKLVGTLDGELLRRFALLQEDWMQQPLQGTRADDFGWWQGEPVSLAQMLGAGASAAAPSFNGLATRLDLLTQQAKALLALGTPGLANEPVVVRWRELRAELDRYNAHAGDSSLARLERYVTAVGPDLRRENCADRLAANPPLPAHEDEIAQRLLQVHRALTRRCEELRVPTGLPLVPAMGLSQ